MMRISLILLIIVLFSDSCNNNVQDASKKLSKEELYNFGLEPDSDVYDFFRMNIPPTVLNKICEETKDFRLISVLFTLKDSIVIECEIKCFSYIRETAKISKKYSSETGKIFKNALMNKKVKFSFINQYDHANYDFRLHLNKYCH